MRVFAISDLHLDETHSKPMDIFGDIWEGQKEKILESFEKLKIESEDVLIIAGDISWAMKLVDAKLDFEFLKALKCNVVILKGNHDYWWSSISAVRDALPENVKAIQNDAIKIGNFIFCGTRGWNAIENESSYAEEDKKIYDREVLRLGLSIAEAKKLQQNGNEIICVMHFPPFNSKKEKNVFMAQIEEAQIETVVFGHLHGKKHNCKAVTNLNGVNYFLTSCDFLENKIIEIK